MSAPPFGVNVAGYVASEKGVGEGARSTIRALAASRIPYVVNAFSDPGSANRETETPVVTDNPYRFNLIHVNPDGLGEFRRRHGRAYFRGRDSVAFWAWELVDFPRAWQRAFEGFQEIWVPSTFTLDAISRMAPIPVVRMPHALAEPPAARGFIRARLGIPADTCLFTFVFDVHSTLGRKNPLGVVSAFRRAFAPDDRVALVLKSVHAASDPAGFAAIRSEADARVHVIDGVWTRAEVQGLLAECDCYVSLHRAEGFGLTIAEAMSLGRPVIVTGYSGNMDFTTVENSFLVRHRLAEVGDEHGQYARGGVWAEPDVEHAAALMRQLYEDRATAARTGQAARRDILNTFSPAAVGERIRGRLTSLMAHARGGGGHVRVYDRVVEHVRTVVNGVVPEHARVLVISKGDDEMLALGSRRAGHFPQAADGTYAGHHPADSMSAIGLLERARERGSQFLVIPSPSLWWLDHYTEFRAHLEARDRRVWSDTGCVVYELVPQGETTVVHRAGRRAA